MQLFIGGACAGKGDIVTARFPDASWLKAGKVGEGDTLTGWRDRLASAPAVVITGWTDWLARALADEGDDDRLRQRLVDTLKAMLEAEERSGGEVVLILPEMGRGIVPLASEERRLRDLAGWFNQDAACRADAVWYVRHGLAQCLKRPC
ncbi:MULTISPECIES: bifunctional adenosylcobinamide kinase/adenosylcobinamide-phosphate guanylyltransferase [Halomonadaceae]|uniref:bifunctional adenosylcobinamide kinase/adenosylcobinamide-phosphate guanylyltransferase n=1 Tax=Halomonadaceae TaxID=28256 RepID=UPI001581D205|nr:MULTISPECIES: bifunctional adenosylcobinamide kinase/adenosylcobinamide-phosphate guanylyltransferase [Halomonas]MDI4637856.1 bifunctional adenosylcobinamide kinase/adenosylcobinamide-phosphate guanylyltransferase [Halomonas sp. BMC7]NUJ58877.1 bifunctional adenosylcobinamide kinase/adenosylcobinamide-phosphate guanylyltransferase [Halomonas taeanensis]